MFKSTRYNIPSTTIQKFVVSNFFLKKLILLFNNDTLIVQSDSKDIYNVMKYLYFK